MNETITVYCLYCKRKQVCIKRGSTHDCPGCEKRKEKWKERKESAPKENERVKNPHYNEEQDWNGLI